MTIKELKEYINEVEETVRKRWGDDFDFDDLEIREYSVMANEVGIELYPVDDLGDRYLQISFY